MQGKTEPLFTKATYWKMREGHESPQWHYTTYPPYLWLVDYFWLYNDNQIFNSFFPHFSFFERDSFKKGFPRA